MLFCLCSIRKRSYRERSALLYCYLINTRQKGVGMSGLVEVFNQDVLPTVNELPSLYQIVT